MEKEYNILVIYDISNDRIRNKIFNILSGYGNNIQKSSFLCILSNRLYKKLLFDLSKIKIDENDSIIIYKMYNFKKNIIGKKHNILDKNYLIL
ncbi:CRISPR-associated endonuclease Cas2 [Brachyspira pulli]|uniref:CRISPR-associated endonuclease Cas2 n=1 Tax=Brachyspira pulli TaxID=310721 RepID=UPI0030045456